MKMFVRYFVFFSLLLSSGFLSAEVPCMTQYPCDDACEWDPHMKNYCCPHVVALPLGKPLFRQFMADPRQIAFSIGWRRDDRVIDHNVGVISFGDTIPVVRFYNPFGRCGALEVTVDGSIWGIFKHMDDTAPLVNSDYYGGISLNYAWSCFALRLRAFHISSHIGDEFLMEAPECFKRLNVSSEFVDLFLSYERCRNMRLYGGIGAVVSSDREFDRDKPYIQYGAEFVFPWWTYYHCPSRLNIEPYVAIDVKQTADNNWNFDGTLAIGYQFAKLCGCHRNLRIFLELHHGYSPDGQFSRLKTDYYALRMTYGY